MKGAIIVLLTSFVFTTHLQNVESKKLTPEQMQENLKPVIKICVERVGVDPKLVEESNKGNFVPDRKLKCYFKCLMLMTKFMKDDKVIVKAITNTIELMLIDDLVEPTLKSFNHCLSVVDQSLEGCELAYELNKCHYEKLKQLMSS